MVDHDGQQSHTPTATDCTHVDERVFMLQYTGVTHNPQQEQNQTMDRCTRVLLSINGRSTVYTYVQLHVRRRSSHTSDSTHSSGAQARVLVYTYTHRRTATTSVTVLACRQKQGGDTRSEVQDYTVHTLNMGLSTHMNRRVGASDNDRQTHYIWQ